MFRNFEEMLFKVMRLEHHPDKPCPHMKDLLSDLSDDTAKGMLRWYTEQHVAGCPGCSATVKALREMRQRLKLLRDGPQKKDVYTLSPERRAALEAAWAEIEGKK